MPLPSDRIKAWWRCFAVQGSWNYRTLVGGGIAFGMLPMLRRIYAGDPVRLAEAVQRHMRSFNGHPYLCAMAVAALARVEQDGIEPETVERFRTALRGPLGTVGDRAVWAQWRPACLLISVVMFLLGAGPIASAAVFLLLYNSGHLVVRTWAFVKGWEAGLAVGPLLKDSWIEHFTRRLWPLNLLMLGGAAVLLGTRLVRAGAPAGLEAPLLGLGVVVALWAFRFPKQGGRLAGALLLLAPMVWWIGDLTR
jgi:mannose/fructose/N-acetylgalactosamine-specific phosphotransferase system component IID